ncbi:MAG: ATP-binding protein [Deltaproteobacteria bacterium]|nr:ATP-binding protein [Deltaproteobacteria bacterium]
MDDARGFLNQFSGKAILDEVQRVPSLFSYIQTIVDEEDSSGRFVLTGSQNFLLLRSISQSLAGRCAILHLLPFAISELEGRKPFPIEKIGHALPQKDRTSHFDLMDMMFSGFYPRIHDKSLNPRDWLANYYRTYVERDVRDIVNVGDIETFGRFVRMCAGRNGQLLNLSSLANDCGITHTTAKRWISILEASFIAILLRPHHRNFSKRLIKSPKLYFLDTGLLCYLLGIRAPEELVLHASRGSVFESLVISEFLKNSLHHGDDPDMFFWRDSGSHEIDAVFERAGELIAVEIKSGQTVAGDFFSGIEYWRKLTGSAKSPAALIYGGKGSFLRRGVSVYSWECL